MKLIHWDIPGGLPLISHSQTDKFVRKTFYFFRVLVFLHPMKLSNALNVLTDLRLAISIAILPTLKMYSIN